MMTDQQPMSDTQTQKPHSGNGSELSGLVSCDHANVSHALGEAIAALYFNDSSDYESALWIIIRDLGGQQAIDAMNENTHNAYHKYAADRDCN